MVVSISLVQVCLSLHKPYSCGIIPKRPCLAIPVLWERCLNCNAAPPIGTAPLQKPSLIYHPLSLSARQVLAGEERVYKSLQVLAISFKENDTAEGRSLLSFFSSRHAGWARWLEFRSHLWSPTPCFFLMNQINCLLVGGCRILILI